MKCGICGQDSTTTHDCRAKLGVSQTVPLSQEYNALRGRSEPQPDYCAFGEACARILREANAERLLKAGYAVNVEWPIIESARSHHIDLGSDKP